MFKTRLTEMLGIPHLAEVVTEIVSGAHAILFRVRTMEVVS